MKDSERQILHREAESIREAIRQAESLIIIASESIRFHAVPEMQNTADVLESLIDPLFKAKNKAKILERTLYRGFIENGNKCLITPSSEDLK